MAWQLWAIPFVCVCFLQEHRNCSTSDGTFRDERFFECEKGCAVFVGLDRLSENRVAVASKPSSSVTSHNLKKQKSVEQQQKQTPFKIGDRVMAFDEDGGTVHGTVKWVGGTNYSKSIGIETVSLSSTLANIKSIINGRL